MKSIGHIIYGVVAYMAICILSSCNHQRESMPHELVSIDSALMKGDYRKAGILLDEYEDQNQYAESETVMMYHKLMRAFLRYRIGKETNSIGLMDSLCNFFDQAETKREFTLSQLIMGDAYRHIQEYPAALDCCLRAETLAKNNKREDILCWTYRQIGQIYKQQLMYEEAQHYFRMHDALAKKLNDVRQMILGAEEMGFVYTYKGDVDSTLYSYKRSIQLAKNRKDSAAYILSAQSRLYDIYIQIEEYDSVKNVMPRDSMNYDNWAYYYQALGNIDSAVFYFKKSIGKHSFHKNRRCLRELIGLEKNRGNLKEVVTLYEQLSETEDSIKKLDKEAETERTQARYDYEQMKQQRDALAKKKERNDWIMGISLSFVLFLIIMAYLYLRSKWKDKEAELEREKLLRHEEETKRKLSEKQLKENVRQQQLLLQQQAEAEAKNDSEALRRLQSEADLLTAENRVIEARQKQHRLLLDEFQKSDLYRRIKQNAGNRDFRLSDEEWLQLSDSLDKVYDHLTKRILNLVNLNSTELRVVYLLKMGVQPADMATILCKSKSSITMIRNRMYKKIFGKSGTATALDEYIQNF